LWDEEDGFYYDHLHLGGQSIPLKISSIVGLMPLMSVDVIDERVVNQLPEFKRRVAWLKKHRPDLGTFMTFLDKSDEVDDGDGMWLLAIPTRQRMERMLKYLLDEDEFLSPFGI